MKNILTLAFVAFLSISCNSCNHKNDLSVSVSESEDEYKFSADYDESDTREVQQHINRTLAPNVVFSGDGDQVVHTKLQDGTFLKVKSSPGELEIKVNKKENSPASVQRIRDMCMSLKEIVAGK